MLPLVSHDEYSDGTADRRTDGGTPDRCSTLSADAARIIKNRQFVISSHRHEDSRVQCDHNLLSTVGRRPYVVAATYEL